MSSWGQRSLGSRWGLGDCELTAGPALISFFEVLSLASDGQQGRDWGFERLIKKEAGKGVGRQVRMLHIANQQLDSY